MLITFQRIMAFLPYGGYIYSTSILVQSLTYAPDNNLLPRWAI